MHDISRRQRPSVSGRSSRGVVRSLQKGVRIINKREAIYAVRAYSVGGRSCSRRIFRQSVLNLQSFMTSRTSGLRTWSSSMSSSVHRCFTVLSSESTSRVDSVQMIRSANPLLVSELRACLRVHRPWEGLALNWHLALLRSAH